MKFLHVKKHKDKIIYLFAVIVFVISFLGMLNGWSAYIMYLLMIITVLLAALSIKIQRDEDKK